MRGIRESFESFSADNCGVVPSCATDALLRELIRLLRKPCGPVVSIPLPPLTPPATGGGWVAYPLVDKARGYVVPHGKNTRFVRSVFFRDNGNVDQNWWTRPAVGNESSAIEIDGPPLGTFTGTMFLEFFIIS